MSAPDEDTEMDWPLLLEDTTFFFGLASASWRLVASSSSAAVTETSMVQTGGRRGTEVRGSGDIVLSFPDLFSNKKINYLHLMENLYYT